GYDTKMGKTLKDLESELGTIRAGGANPDVLDRITVEYYGAPTPLQQVANSTVPEGRMIQIQPWDGTLLKLIEKAVLVSVLGIEPRRKSESECTGRHYRRLLRSADSAAAGGEYHGAGSTHDPDPAVGRYAPEADREGNPCL